MASFRTSAAGGATSGTSDRSATITPAVGDLFVVYAFVSTNTNDAPTCSDNNGGSYTLVDVANVVISTVNHRLSVFVRDSLLANTTSTTVTVATGSNTSGAIHVIAYSGLTRTGAAAVRSTGLQDNQAAGTAAPTLNQAALTGNPTIVAQGSADTTTTAPTNWTEAQDTNFATPTIALETAYRDSGFTGTTITFGAASSTTFCSHALELDASEFVGPGKWNPHTPDYRNPVPKIAAALIPALFFVPVETAAPSTTVFIGGQSPDPITVEDFQYDDLAEPVYVAAAAEVVTSDKWARPIETPPTRLTPRPQTTGIRAVYVPAAAPAATVFIGGQSPDPITVEDFQYDDLAEPVYVPSSTPETVTSDKWRPYWPQPTFKPRRLIQYGVNCAVASEVDEESLDRWAQPQSLPRFTRATFRANGLFAPPPAPIAPAVETVTSDKWAQAWPQPQATRKPVQGQGVTPAYQPQAPKGWEREQERPQQRLLRRTDAKGELVFVVAQGSAETVTLDKWGRPVETPQRRATPRPDVAQARSTLTPTSPVETLTTDKWLRPTETPTRKAVQRPDLAQTRPVLTPAAPVEAVTADRWGQPQGQPQRRLLRPLPVVSDFLSAVRELLTGWLRPTEQPRRGVLRIIPADSQPPRVVETPNAGWLRSTEQPRRTEQVRTQTDAARPLQRIDEAPTMGWLRDTEQPAHPVTYGHLYPTFTADAQLDIAPVQIPTVLPVGNTVTVNAVGRFEIVPAVGRMTEVRR